MLRLVVRDEPDYGLGFINFLTRGGCEPSEDGAQDEDAPIVMTSSINTGILHELNHKPASKACDACVRGKMKNLQKYKGSFSRPYQILVI